MKLIVMRHSECEGLDEGIINGWLDLKLTEEGIKKAKCAADKLKPYVIDKAYSSYLSRAYDTAKYLLHALNQCVKVEQDIRLNERHYGAFQGMKRKVAYSNPKYNTLSVSCDRLENELIPLSDEAYEKQLEEYSLKLGVDKDTLELPRSESILQVEERIIEFLKDKIFISENENKTVLVVGHANTVKLITKYIENLSYEETTELRFATCGMNIYDIKYNEIKMDVLNLQRINEEYVN